MTDRFILANGEIVRANGEIIELTAPEAVILGGLWKHRGYFIHRTRQAQWIWGNRDGWPDTWGNVLGVHHSRLRHKIAKCSFSIQNKVDYGDQLRGELIVDSDDPHPKPEGD